MGIVAENRTEMKRLAKSLINTKQAPLSKPLQKFVMEMTLGMAVTGTCCVTEIGRKLGEETALKHTLKRLSHMLARHGETVLEHANHAGLKTMAPYLSDQTVLAVDGGDLIHMHGRTFEHLATVKDGSTGQLEQGYWLNQVTGYDPASQTVFPLLLDIYSTREKGFQSANTETLSMIRRVRAETQARVLWVMDRGYDSGIILHHLLRNEEEFTVRMTRSRNLVHKGKTVSITSLVEGVNRRYALGKYARFGTCKAQICLRKTLFDVTLIVVKNKGSREPIFFLANGWIKSGKELKRRINGYFHRWGIEEAYRFEKQGLGLERMTVRHFGRTKGLVGLSLLAWLLLAKANQSLKLRGALEKAAKPEKTAIHRRPKFLYYRLQKGLQELFTGTKRLFGFRLRNQNQQNNDPPSAQPLLFPQFLTHPEWSLEWVG